MEGKGVDIILNSNIIDRRFRWSMQLLFSYASDKVTKFDVINTPANIVYNQTLGTTPIVNRPVFAVYSYRSAGLDPLTGDPRGYAGDTISKVYSALANPSSIQDIVYNGSATPRFYGGFTNTFSWNRFTLSTTITYKLGYYFHRNAINYTSLFDTWTGDVEYAERWKKPGDEALTKVPSFPTTKDANRDFFYSLSESTVEKGDHIRLKDAMLLFDMYKNNFKKLLFNHIQLFVYANNIAIIWRANEKGIDPDFIKELPSYKSVSVGIKANF
jgi:hypothetical protein